MTLIAAIGCSDGIVLAADSSSSDPVYGTQQRVDKIRTLGANPILYGGSGDGGLLQKIDESLSRFSTKNNLKNLRKELKQLIMPDLQESRQFHVPYPDQHFHNPPVSVLLFAGILDRAPWIIEIERDGRDTYYGKEVGFFAAIGSGKPLAEAFISSYRNTERDLNLGKIIAYRIMDEAIKLSAGYVDKPIHIFTIDLDGNITRLGEAEIRQLMDTCELWKELERETLGKLRGNRMKEEIPPVPKPE